jgi:hypothetical protein
MSDERVENSTIKDYLLGDLPESEFERIEKWYFASGQAVDEVWAAFGELAEERLSGALSKDQAERFDQRLRSAPALLEMFVNEKAIDDYVARNATTIPMQVKGDDPGAAGWRPWRRFAAFFKSTRLIAVGAVAIVAIGALGFWLALRTPVSPNPESAQQALPEDKQDHQVPNNVAQPSVDRPPEEKKTAEQKPDQSKPAAAGRGSIVRLLLLAGVTRGAEVHSMLEIPGRTETVQLELEPPTDTCSVFSAILQTDSGEVLQRWERLRAARSFSTLKLARLRVRADSLKNTDYVVRLECVSGSKNSTSNAEYRFKVEKK